MASQRALLIPSCTIREPKGGPAIYSIKLWLLMKTSRNFHNFFSVGCWVFIVRILLFFFYSCQNPWYRQIQWRKISGNKLIGVEPWYSVHFDITCFWPIPKLCALYRGSTVKDKKKKKKRSGTKKYRCSRYVLLNKPNFS